MTGTIFQPPIFAFAPVGAMAEVGLALFPTADPWAGSLGSMDEITPMNFQVKEISILVLCSGSYLKEIYI